jgi:hypothetical protein
MWSEWRMTFGDVATGVHNNYNISWCIIEIPLQKGCQIPDLIGWH